MSASISRPASTTTASSSATDPPATTAPVPLATAPLTSALAMSASPVGALDTLTMAIYGLQRQMGQFAARLSDIEARPLLALLNQPNAAVVAPVDSMDSMNMGMDSMDMGGGFGRLPARRRKVRSDELTGAVRATALGPRARYASDCLARVTDEHGLYDGIYNNYSYRAADPFDFDGEHWPYHKVSILPVKRSHTASTSVASAASASAAAAANPTRHASPDATRVDPVVAAAPAAPAADTPPNAAPAAETAPRVAAAAPDSAPKIVIVPPKVGRSAPAAASAMPWASPYQRLAARRSTLLRGSMRPAGTVSSTKGMMWTCGLSGGSGSVVSAPKAAALGMYCRDMTAKASKMDPVIGRDDEIDRIVCILCRRTKNSAMLVGAPGVGKTAIAEGLAQRIVAGAVPAALAGARVVEVDLGAMVAGTKYRGTFEERIKKVIEEVVLFIDEVHMLLGAGQSKGGSMDGANLLKPALARGRIRCVGATAFNEHRKYVENDAAFERRFQKVHVEEPSLLATIAILQGLKEKYEEHHGAEIQDAAIVAAARLANCYITGRQFPDKAIDLIDEACATARMQTDNILKGSSTQHVSENATKEAIVSPGQVAEVVSRWTGTPVNTLDQDEKEKLMCLADRLRERVVGQEAAVNLVAQTVLRQLAKALAEQLFDSEKMLIRFDMTEFVGSHSVLRLIGAPPSYHGHQDGGQLTEKVRQRPYNVILFDEIEKADPAVFNVLLQLLDDGVLTDGKGRTVDFKNTIIIMTSNLGAQYLMKAMAGEKSMEAARGFVIEQAQKHFRPEFLNRLSELVIFEPLSQDKLREVAKVQMKGIIARAADKGITLSASDAALDVVLSESHNPLYGARPIRRWLQKNVMTNLSEMLFRGEIDVDTAAIIEASEDKKDLKYEVVKNTSERQARRQDKMPLVGTPCDSESDDDVKIIIAPTAKKMKGVAIPTSPGK
ncbi:hypothetical protein C2845_PM12G16910 [Panicum miliaceum]|uniref:Uncharacterized protein n=1 Tax=Panicum miliaceum TaxID=4540 RepID=A0A3L6QGH3_PANMI|nr:hypothetical protein C2845_PM12G16910 [Panicum miliaceum]